MKYLFNPLPDGHLSQEVVDPLRLKSKQVSKIGLLIRLFTPVLKTGVILSTPANFNIMLNDTSTYRFKSDEPMITVVKTKKDKCHTKKQPSRYDITRAVLIFLYFILYPLFY